MRLLLLPLIISIKYIHRNIKQRRNNYIVFRFFIVNLVTYNINSFFIVKIIKYNDNNNNNYYKIIMIMIKIKYKKIK